MKLTNITDQILEKAIAAQPKGRQFDTHDVAFWIMQKRPREYVKDLALALDNEREPFMNVNGMIGKRLARLPALVRRAGRPRKSPNVRGQKSLAGVWVRV